MRIVGGEARGRRIHLPAGCRIRPTADRVKESLFDILHSVEGSRFLDLYAGCGNVGLEALSRGALTAVFVEKTSRLADAIRGNLRVLGFETRAEVLAADAETGIRRLAGRGAWFDICFADPPYGAGFVTALLNALEEVDLLAADGIAVLQHSVREELPAAHAGRLVVFDRRRYGDTVLSFLRRE